MAKALKTPRIARVVEMAYRDKEKDSSSTINNTISSSYLQGKMPTSFNDTRLVNKTNNSSIFSRENNIEIGDKALRSKDNKAFKYSSIAKKVTIGPCDKSRTVKRAVIGPCKDKRASIKP